MFDLNPTRCRGAGRGARRCKRHGQPVNGEYWCYQHAHQRDGEYGRLMRQLDEEEKRVWWGVYE